MRTHILTLATITSLAATGLVQASENAWLLLASVEFDEIEEDGNWLIKKSFSPELIAAQDDFQISGYVVPVTPEPYIKTFILIEDPGNCPFCGADSYGPILEVHLKRPMPNLVEFTEITVEGHLELVEASDTYQSYRLLNAIPR